MPSCQAATSSSTTMHASMPSAKPRVASVSPAQQHALDVARAARMGIDLSHLAPGERCKYPSKFCCNVRARKTTGKLHRFCEEHRARAKVNQRRWTDERRRQDKHAHESAAALCADTAAWLDLTKPLLAPALPLVICAPKPDALGEWRVAASEPSSPTNVDAALEDDDLPLSEHDIDMLTTIVAQCEQSSEVMTMADAWLMSMLQEETDAPMERCAAVEAQ